MKVKTLIKSLLLFSLITPLLTQGAINLGVLSDFEDGTVQGWSGNGSSPVSNIATGGPAGTGDNFLQFDGAVRFATKNTSISGVLDSAVTAFTVDMMRPAGNPSLEMRLVLFGPSTGDRWTSTNEVVVPNDGVWRNYEFSVLETDLTRVLGSNTYANLVASVNRIMFRYDPDPANSTGVAAAGNMGIDNVTAIPEPGQIVLIASLATFIFAIRRRK